MSDKFIDLFIKYKIIDKEPRLNFMKVGYDEACRILSCPIEDNFMECEILKKKGNVLIGLKLNNKFVENMTEKDIIKYNDKVDKIRTNYILHYYMTLKKKNDQFDESCLFNKNN
jgi:hypothetical protein